MKIHPDQLTFVALGSNLGDSVATVKRAIEDLKGMAGESFVESSLWQTEPVDCPPGSGLFINAIVGWSPPEELTPEGLLVRLLAMERDYGRRGGGGLNAPRTLDLDLISFKNDRRASAELTLPHPRAHLRHFVLAPLAELAPDWVFLDGKRETVSGLLAGLRADSRQSVRRLTR